jgi:hypothetical protein
VTDLRRIDKCKACDAPIVWAKTPNGKVIPIDAEPSPDGNVVLFAGPGSGELLAFFRNVKGAHRLHKSHFATCPNADRFRKWRAKAAP